MWTVAARMRTMFISLLTCSLWLWILDDICDQYSFTAGNFCAAIPQEEISNWAVPADSADFNGSGCFDNRCVSTSHSKCEGNDG